MAKKNIYIYLYIDRYICQHPHPEVEAHSFLLSFVRFHIQFRRRNPNLERSYGGEKEAWSAKDVLPAAIRPR